MSLIHKYAIMSCLYPTLRVSMALTNHFDLILLLHLACYILEYEISQSCQPTYSVLNSMCCNISLML